MKTVTVIALCSFLLIGSVLVGHGSAMVPYPADRDDGNDTPETATAVTVPHEGDYEIEPVGDIDWYKMELSAGTFLLIYTERINDSQLDPRAIFYGPHSETGEDVDSSSWIANDDDSHGDLQPEIRIPIEESGFYFLRISYYSNWPTLPGQDQKPEQRADTGEYRLFLQEVPDQPDISVWPTWMEFGLQMDQTADKYLYVYNYGNLPLNVTSITNVEPWLSVDLTTFTVPVDLSQSVTVTANATGLAEGTYADTISIVSDDPDENLTMIPVTLTVVPPDGNDTPETATPITVPHVGDYAIEVEQDVDWYRMFFDAGTIWVMYTERINDSQVDPRAFFYGPHSETGEDVDPANYIFMDYGSHGDQQPEIQILIEETGYYFLRISQWDNWPVASGQEQIEDKGYRTGDYRLFVEEAPDQPDISVSPSSLSFGLSSGQTAEKELWVYNNGNIPLNVTSITNAEPWLTVDPVTFNVPEGASEIVTVTADAAGLADGTYADTISIVSNDPDESLVTIPVMLIVAPPDGNDTPETATAINVPHTGDYSIAIEGDIDWYRMYMDAGTGWTIYTERIDGSQLDPRAILYGPHSEGGEDVDPTIWIANDDDSHGDLQPEIRITITETGYYFLRISYYSDLPTGGGNEQKAGQRGNTGPYRLVVSSGVHGDMAMPNDVFRLSTSPNPADNRLAFGIWLPTETYVKLGIYDLSGRLVLVPVQERLTSGYHTRVCDAHALSPGAYLARLRAGDQTATQRILISR